MSDEPFGPEPADDGTSDDGIDDMEPDDRHDDAGTRRTSWDAAELMTVVFPEPQWAVPGVLAEGLSLLVGAPKLGKSWLALGLGVAIASGGKAFGSIDVDAGDVLYLALEDNGRRLQSRLRSVLGDSPAPSRLLLATTCAPLPEGGAKRIAAWLDRHPGARLVIVDVFSRVRGRMNDRANLYAADYAAMTAVKDIADRYGVCILVLHHTRKSSAIDFLDTVSGTQGLAGAADAVLVLTRSRGTAGAVLKLTGRDIEEAEHALDFDPRTGTWKMLDGPASDYNLSGQRLRILHAVRDQEGIGPKQIAEATGLDYDVVRHLVRKMVDDDKLDTDGNGHYCAVHTVHNPESGSERSERSERHTPPTRSHDDQAEDEQ